LTEKVWFVPLSFLERVFERCSFFHFCLYRSQLLVDVDADCCIPNLGHQVVLTTVSISPLSWGLPRFGHTWKEARSRSSHIPHVKVDRACC
jgi:hypothetical protein